MYSTQQHGAAEYSHYIHVLSGSFDLIPQGDESENIRNRKYAQVVYDISSLTPGSPSLEYAINNSYSRIVQSGPSGETYMAYAPPGSPTSGNVWRVKQITSTGDVLWADNANFSQSVTDPLSGLTYTY